jgi:hypothetical protein
VVSATAAIWAGRMEMINVFLRALPDIDLHAPSPAGLKLWRWIGRAMMVGAAALGLMGVNKAMQVDPLEGGWLMVIALFPAAFGKIMTLRVPEQASGFLSPWGRKPRG